MRLGGVFLESIRPTVETLVRVLSEASLSLTKGEALDVIISKQINNKDNLKINKDLDLKATYCPRTKINGEWQFFGRDNVFSHIKDPIDFLLVSFGKCAVCVYGAETIFHHLLYGKRMVIVSLPIKYNLFSSSKNLPVPLGISSCNLGK